VLERGNQQRQGLQGPFHVHDVAQRQQRRHPDRASGSELESGVQERGAPGRIGRRYRRLRRLDQK
jgi:hypothetical protein